MDPAPDPSKGNGSLPDLELPLRLDDLELRTGWEGQPAPNMPEYVVWGWVNDQFIDLRVYLGTQTPTAEMLAEAEDVLATLQVPEGR